MPRGVYFRQSWEEREIAIHDAMERLEKLIKLHRDGKIGKIQLASRVNQLEDSLTDKQREIFYERINMFPTAFWWIL